MTKPRFYGESGAFSEWLRRQPDLDASACGLTINDVDFVFHHYKTYVGNEVTRRVQLMFSLEVKTNFAMPDSNQQQTLFFVHQLLSDGWRKKKFIDFLAGCKVSLRHFGVFVLQLSSTTPDNSHIINFYKFNKEKGSLEGLRISTETLKGILRFDARPDDFGRIDLRPHHKTQRVQELRYDSLGFPYYVDVVKRS